VFPARYELNSYIVFRKRLVSKRITFWRLIIRSSVDASFFEQYLFSRSNNSLLRRIVMYGSVQSRPTISSATVTDPNGEHSGFRKLVAYWVTGYCSTAPRTSQPLNNYELFTLWFCFIYQAERMTECNRA
jgi:hypothetical protein